MKIGKRQCTERRRCVMATTFTTVSFPGRQAICQCLHSENIYAAPADYFYNNNSNKHFEVIFPTLVGVSLLLPMTEPSISLHPLHHFSPNLQLSCLSQPLSPMSFLVFPYLCSLLQSSPWSSSGTPQPVPSLDKGGGLTSGRASVHKNLCLIILMTLRIIFNAALNVTPNLPCFPLAWNILAQCPIYEDIHSRAYRGTLPDLSPQLVIVTFCIEISR